MADITIIIDSIGCDYFYLKPRKVADVKYKTIKTNNFENIFKFRLFLNQL